MAIKTLQQWRVMAKSSWMSGQRIERHGVILGSFNGDFHFAWQTWYRTVHHSELLPLVKGTGA